MIIHQLKKATSIFRALSTDPAIYRPTWKPLYTYVPNHNVTSIVMDREVT